MKNDEILSFKELCEYLKLPKNTVYCMCRSGKFPSFKAGKQLRFRKSAIDKWIIEQERKRKKERSVVKK